MRESLSRIRHLNAVNICGSEQLLTSFSKANTARSRLLCWRERERERERGGGGGGEKRGGRGLVGLRKRKSKPDKPRKQKKQQERTTH